MQSQSLTGQWQFRQEDENEWLPATVPGGVHTDLLTLGLIPDPFIGDNELDVMWIAEKDWTKSASRDRYFHNIGIEFILKVHLCFEKTFRCFVKLWKVFP